ncbi:Carbonate dehydratase eukaryotic-type [Trichostrongylus colubriformis]|uniref:Carbonate dehydratase eukaryotic-type n=1 Tax=Trichostrongylus colubriformis TaxID=6319 RepID=A0AAN8G3I7_TRICO
MYRALFVTPLGERQSPINIPTEDVICDPKMCQPSSMKLTYHEGDCTDVIAEPDTWKIRTSDQCKTVLSASHLPAEFRLKQVHGHWGLTPDCGTEHAIDYQHYASEVHFVFWNTTYEFDETGKYPDGLAVVAVFLTVGKYNKDYGHISSVVREAVRSQAPVAMSTNFNLTKLLPLGSDYIHYQGSLTTPPFTECVLWTLMLKPIEISQKQVLRNEQHRLRWIGKRIGHVPRKPSGVTGLMFERCRVRILEDILLYVPL